MSDKNQPRLDLFAARVDYAQSFDESDLAPNPLEQFLRWYAEAEASDQIIEPQAMIASTAGTDGPTSRTVLCKSVTAEGFAFATNYESQKGQDIAADPRISLLFPWHALQRQVIVRGVAERGPAEASDEYFAQRPYRSQVSAVISEQSRPIESRDLLHQRWNEYEAELAQRGSAPQRPETWGFYLVRPTRVEFWAGSRSRLHDRLVYTPTGVIAEVNCANPPLDDDRAWGMHRLQP
ncbi:pyridoxamine 5'-phosphate oxidase [Micrococcales bacterium 31B]|nr:pyridoxamine 5'-phosphate oxidase [Micrococcales bacterium 31B]